jgi:peptide-methionine (R)-S-oxide reductase
MAAVPTPAASPLPGAWVAAQPGGRAIALGLLAIAVVLAAAYLVTRPPADAAAAARFAAASLSTGMLIAPSARVGWFVVPLLLAAAGSVHRASGGHSLGSMDPAAEPVPKVVKSDAEWRAQLTPAEYQVLRKAGTERPFTGEYTDTKTQGVYSCRACGAELFRSDTKFESHCGWPSFFTPLAGDAVIERVDTSLGMRRVEVLCATCHSHLGHVFEGEGYPTPTDLRYCINSISLRLEPDAG